MSLSPAHEDDAPKLFLRPSVQDDQEFLFQLFASTRAQEFAALGWDRVQLEALLRMQWSTQQRWYETAYAPSQQQIVMYGEAPIGRMIVQHVGAAKTLVDISLMPEHRGRGIGSRLLGDLIDQCSQEKVCLRLQVLKTNPAARLYRRLGFVISGEDEMYFQMEKPAP
jgi:ribosomal protein S18 acetylase RimI-like enzyme